MWLTTVAGRHVVSANILTSPKRKLGDSMSDWLNASCDAAPLMAVLVRSAHEQSDRETTSAAPRRNPLPLTASESPDTRTFTGEGRCLDSRSSSDLTSGGDLSKAHPNYQTPTRGQAMQQVVTRGRRGNGRARCCQPRFAWAKAPTRLARTPGHASGKGLARRFSWSCRGGRRHRFPQDLGISGTGGVRAMPTAASARPSCPHRASCMTIPERVPGTTYPLSAGAVGYKTPTWHRNIRWQAGRSWGGVRP